MQSGKIRKRDGNGRFSLVMCDQQESSSNRKLQKALTYTESPRLGRGVCWSVIYKSKLVFVFFIRCLFVCKEPSGPFQNLKDGFWMSRLMTLRSSFLIQRCLFMWTSFCHPGSKIPIGGTSFTPGNVYVLVPIGKLLLCPGSNV